METKTESTTTKQTQRNLFLSYVGSHVHFWTSALFLGGWFFLDNSVQVLFLIQVRWFPLNIPSQTLVKVYSLTLGDKFNPKNIWGCKHAPGLTFHLLSFGLETVDENPE